MTEPIDFLMALTATRGQAAYNRTVARLQHLDRRGILPRSRGQDRTPAETPSPPTSPMIA